MLNTWSHQAPLPAVEPWHAAVAWSARRERINEPVRGRRQERDGGTRSWSDRRDRGVGGEACQWGAARGECWVGTANADATNLEPVGHRSIVCQCKSDLGFVLGRDDVLR